MVPTLDLLCDPQQIREWTLWLQHFYTSSNTACNKTTHVANLIRWCQWTCPAELWDGAKAADCLMILQRAAQVNKTKGLRQCAAYHNSERHMANGNPKHHTLVCTTNASPNIYIYI